MAPTPSLCTPSLRPSTMSWCSSNGTRAACCFRITPKEELAAHFTEACEEGGGRHSPATLAPSLSDGDTKSSYAIASGSTQTPFFTAGLQQAAGAHAPGPWQLLSHS